MIRTAPAASPLEWVQRQTWEDLLFAHWTVPASVLRPLVPPSLELDAFEGQTWVGIIPFRLTGLRFRWAPPLPGFTQFHEINVRTYVTDGQKPGVWFLSLDATTRFPVWSARRFYHLPYYLARMSFEPDGSDVRLTSRRVDRRGQPAELAITYGPRGSPATARPGSLEEWLVERYCLYAEDERHAIWRCDIEHPPWLIQPAAAALEVETLAATHGLSLEKPPLHCLFAKQQDTLVGWPQLVARS
ncbi:MAG TPA: DUF2071 domain-containing protein [Planctomycetota bacterium]|nr:DUF2071 domain-containing protein [Planctomycetota bacterium]